MPSVDSTSNLNISLIDRLIDFEPARSKEATLTQTDYNITNVKESVRRDLEWFLNTRRMFTNLPPHFVELKKSLVTYGLPDLSSFDLAAPENQNRLCGLLEKAIETFEPRLRQVQVSLEMQPSHGKSIMFKIEATLLVEPLPEPVVFDTIAEISSGEYTVKGSGF